MIYLNENGGRQVIWIPSKGKANGYNGATAPLYQEITENGEYVWERSNGYSPVTVKVDVAGGKEEQTKSVTITENSTISVTPDTGKVLSSVDVTTDVHPKEKLVQTITENGTTNLTGEWKDAEISVDVPQTGKVDVEATGTRLAHSYFTTVPDIYDFSNCTDMNFMFSGCQDLVTIPQIVTSKVTRMFYMFQSAYALETIPPLDTRNVWEMTYMFIYCRKLTTVQQLDMSNVTEMRGMFMGCTSLSSLTLAGSLNASLELNDSPLNEESIKSVLTAASKTINTTAKTLTFKEGSTFTDDAAGTWAALVADCTTKGWTIQNLTLA